MDPWHRIRIRGPVPLTYGHNIIRIRIQVTVSVANPGSGAFLTPRTRDVNAKPQQDYRKVRVLHWKISTDHILALKPRKQSFLILHYGLRQLTKSFQTLTSSAATPQTSKLFFYGELACPACGNENLDCSVLEVLQGLLSVILSPEKKECNLLYLAPMQNNFVNPVLRIRDVYSRSRRRNLSIPDPNFFHPGSRIRIKQFKYFNPKNR